MLRWRRVSVRELHTLMKLDLTQRYIVHRILVEVQKQLHEKDVIEQLQHLTNGRNLYRLILNIVD